jgi:hypothetical protein
MTRRGIVAAVVFAVCGLGAVCARPVLAQSGITTTIDSVRVTVGDRLHLTVSVEHASSSAVTWPDSLDLAPFEVLDVEAAEPTPSGDGARSTLVVTLAAFELGRKEIPSFDVVVTAADGTEETLETNLVGVDVVSVGVDESGDIRDIRGPLAIPLGALRLALWVLGPLLVAGLLWVLARRLRPGKEDASPTRAALPRPAHEVALEALAALERAGLIERGQVKEYHIEASDILRTYVGQRFRVDSLEMTSDEVLTALERRGADPRTQERLRGFLEQCDLVKFAKVKPSPDAARLTLELGRRIVLDSVPTPEPAAPAAVRAGATEAA